MADILAALRSLMASHSPPLDALAVPSEDYHQVNSLSFSTVRIWLISAFELDDRFFETLDSFYIPVKFLFSWSHFLFIFTRHFFLYFIFFKCFEFVSVWWLLSFLCFMLDYGCRASTYLQGTKGAHSFRDSPEVLVGSNFKSEIIIILSCFILF